MKNSIRTITVVCLAITLTSCCVGRDAFLCRAIFSPSAGFNFSNLSEDGDYGTDNNESKLGFQFGANALFPLNDNFRLQTGLGYASKGSKSSYEGEEYEFGEETFSQEDKLNLSYLEVPLLANYKFDNTGFYAYGGLQPSVLLGAKQKIEATGSPSQDVDVKDRFKSVDAAAVFGIGYEFANGLMLNIGYDLGLVNIAESTDFGTSSVKNRSFKFSLAYNFDR